MNYISVMDVPDEEMAFKRLTSSKVLKKENLINSMSVFPL